MRIAFDLTWMSKNNQSGGVFQYSHRLVSSLVMYTDLTIIVLISPGEESNFSNLTNSNFRIVIFNRITSSLKDIVKQEKIDAIHTPLQQHVNYTLTVPMINTLHDLQPFYFPDFFSPEEIEYRNIHYRKSAEFSERVVVTYQHVKNDLVRFYKIPPDKIDVCGPGIAIAEPVSTEEIDEIRRKYRLPPSYLLYPANTWRHKNHIGLLRGLKLLHHKYGLKLPLICTGYQHPEFFPQIEQEISRLGLSDCVTFVGYLPEEDMPKVLRGASLTVIPTLYEAGSFPLMEAMIHEVPVICSAVTSLPETIGDDRFLFDPNSPEEMAEKIKMMLTDDWMRNQNVANSKSRVKAWRWEKAVLPFIHCYQEAIKGFTGRQQWRWYQDWALNYEFFSLKVESKLRRELGFYIDELAKARAGVEYATNHMHVMEESWSWRLTSPLRTAWSLFKKIHI